MPRRSRLKEMVSRDQLRLTDCAVEAYLTAYASAVADRKGKRT